MDGLTFAVEMVKAMAWPLVALVAVLLFRQELRALLLRIKKGKVGAAEFEFEDRVAMLRGRVGEADAKTTAAAAQAATEAQNDPRSVILNAWLGVQSKVDAIVANQGTAEDRRDAGSVSLRLLHRILRDKPEYIDLYNDLKSLRNQAVHDPSFAPRSSSVVEYVALANELGAVLAPYASGD
jgi:hypothetical protein